MDDLHLKQGSNVPYLVAVIVIILIGVVAVLVIVLMRPDKDNTQLLANVMTMIIPTTAAVLAFMKSQETHKTVNSDLEKWKRDFSEKFQLLGEKIGTEKEQARVANLKIERSPDQFRSTDMPIAQTPAPVPVEIVSGHGVDAAPLEVNVQEKPKGKS